MTAFNDIHFVYACILRLYCIYLFLTSLEYVYLLPQFSDGGIFSWKIMKLSMHPRLAKTGIGFLFNKTGTSIIILTRLALSIYLFIAPIQPLTVYPVAILVATSLLLALRNSIGNDGTDQMSMIISTTLLITFLSGDPNIASIGLYFIATQSILAYVIAGIAKLLSPKWRSGLAVFQIMNTETYGYEKIATFLQRSNPLVSKSLSWSIMLFESSYFLVVLLPYPFFLALMIWGILFHLFNAFVMGLNHFFWVFLATYPAIIYSNMALHHYLH